MTGVVNVVMTGVENVRVFIQKKVWLENILRQ